MKSSVSGRRSTMARLRDAAAEGPGHIGVSEIVAQQVLRPAIQLTSLAAPLPGPSVESAPLRPFQMPEP